MVSKQSNILQFSLILQQIFTTSKSEWVEVVVLHIAISKQILYILYIHKPFYSFTTPLQQLD